MSLIVRSLSIRSRTLGLATATYGAALVALLTSVVLTRSMSPEDFGSYRYVLAVIGFGAVVANLGLPYSAAHLLTRQHGPDQARTIASSLQLLLMALVLASALIGGFAILMLGHLDAAPLLLVAAGLMWTITIQRHFMYTLRGSGRTREIAVQTLMPPTVILALTTSVAVFSDELHLGWALTVTAMAYLATHLWTATRLSVWHQGHLKPERLAVRAAQSTTGIPIYKGALVSVGVGEFVVVLGGAYVGQRAFGDFSLALSLAAPVATLPTVIGMVNFRKFGQQSTMPIALLRHTALKSAALGATGLGAGWVVFPWIFPEQLNQARYMFPVMALGFFAHGLGDYLNQFLQAQGEGLRIKRAAYTVGLLTAGIGILTIPTLGVWGLVAAKLTGSTAYVTSMIAITARRNSGN